MSTDFSFEEAADEAEADHMWLMRQHADAERVAACLAGQTGGDAAINCGQELQLRVNDDGTAVVEAYPEDSSPWEAPINNPADARLLAAALTAYADAAQHRQAMAAADRVTATDSIPVDALIRYAETEASAAEARAAGAGSDLFKRSNQHIWAAWSAFAGNLRTYSIDEMQAMADEDLTDAKEL